MNPSLPFRETTIAERRLVRAESTPATAPYSTAAVLGDVVWTSGALPVETDGSTSDDFATQVRTALRNLQCSLQAAGADWGTVLKINGYVSDIERLPEMNEVYAEYFPKEPPARYCIKTELVKPEFLVEISSIAHIRG